MRQPEKVPTFGLSAPLRAASAAPLGIYAKTASAPPQLAWIPNRETGETWPFEGQFPRLRPHVTPREARAQRFALKSVVNRIMPASRTAKCCRWRVPTQDICVMKSREHGKAHYAGLQVCASVWACPVCAAKISERRRAELQGAIATATAKGWQVQLMTLTVPHGLGDDLKLMLDHMMDAWRALSSTRAGSAARRAVGLRGTVRALEVTHGANGWHPHFHVLLFLDSAATPAAVRASFLPLWQAACVKAGLPRPSDAHGLDVRDGSYAAQYASKWGLESEMTKGHVKQGREGSATPWDFLRAQLETRCDRSRRLFVAYASAFKGRRQLYWSNGLRKLLGVEDVADEELAAQQDDSAVMLAQLTDEQWQAVLATRSESALLDVAERHPDALEDFLAALVAMASRCGAPPHGGGRPPHREGEG